MQLGKEMSGPDLGGLTVTGQRGRVSRDVTFHHEASGKVQHCRQAPESFLKPNYTDEPWAPVCSNLEAQSVRQAGVWSVWQDAALCLGDQSKRTALGWKPKGRVGGQQSHSPRAGLDVGIKQFCFWIGARGAVGSQVCSGVSRAEPRCFCSWVCFAHSLAWEARHISSTLEATKESNSLGFVNQPRGMAFNI